MTREEALHKLSNYLDSPSIRAAIADDIADVVAYYEATYGAHTMLRNEYDETVVFLTLGADIDDDGCVSYALQSGDNSYTGPAYGFPYWGVAYYSAGTTPAEYADELIDDLINALPW